jgi:hypothetical protein
MLPPMPWLLPFLACVLLFDALPAQRPLAALQRQFIAAARELDAKQPTRAQRDELLQRQIAELRAFVAGEAKGDDRWNGRLMLADLLLARADREGAKEALAGIDATAAGALLLVTAATMAQHLGMTAQRDRWLDAALAKDAPLEDRLAMARLLMTVLHDIARGEALFAQALDAAGDDEQRAFVRWHRADALRDREDLPDNAGFEELEKLAKELPATYWGSVARDRLRATALAVGDPAIDFRATARGGKPIALADLRGKAVVLAFWTSGDFDTPTLFGVLRDLARRHGEALAVITVALDRDDGAIADAVQRLGIDFPVIGDGKGILHDVPLRWFVEGPVVHVLDAAGRVAALGLHAGTADGRDELAAAVARAVRK